MKEKSKARDKIRELDDAKENLSSSLMGAKEESRKFTSRIDEIDMKLEKVEKEYEQADGLLDELRLNLQTFRLHARQVGLGRL